MIDGSIEEMKFVENYIDGERVDDVENVGSDNVEEKFDEMV